MYHSSVRRDVPRKKANRHTVSSPTRSGQRLALASPLLRKQLSGIVEYRASIAWAKVRREGSRAMLDPSNVAEVTASCLRRRRIRCIDDGRRETETSESQTRNRGDG